MKNKTKKLNKIGILLFGISLLLTLANCQKEDISDFKETTANSGTESARTQNRTKGDFVVYIDTTSIKAATNGEMGTFTMPVVTRDHSKNFFTNVVLSKKKTESDWRYTFIRYWPTPYWSNLNDQSDEAPPFDGTIEIMDEHGDVKMLSQFVRGESVNPDSDFQLEYVPFTYSDGGGCSCSGGGGFSVFSAVLDAIGNALSAAGGALSSVWNWLGEFFSGSGSGSGSGGDGGSSFYGGYFGYELSGEYDYTVQPPSQGGGGGSGSGNNDDPTDIAYTMTNPDTGKDIIYQWLPGLHTEQLDMLIANTTPDGTSLYAAAIGYLSQGGGSASSIASRVLNSECLSLNDKIQILSYLNENNVPIPDDPTGELNFSQQETFVQEAITAVCEGGAEVDWEYQVIEDESFKNNECLYGVFEDMGKAPTFNNYLQNFIPQGSVANLKFSASTSLPDSINAQTSAPSNYLITITFNENNLDRPSLSVARTMMHEMMHAEIFRKLLSVAQQPNLDFTQWYAQDPQIWYDFIVNLRNSFEGLYDYYMRLNWNIPPGQSPSDVQHNLMASHYRDIIKQALQQYDDSQSDEVYEALSWAGLHGTIAWNNLTQAERDSINQTVNNFYNNNPNCQ